MVLKVLHVEIASFARFGGISSTRLLHPLSLVGLAAALRNPFPNVRVCSLPALLPVLFIGGHPQTCGRGTVERPFSIPDIRDVGWRLPVGMPLLL